jgi:protoheme IX farnesyltransferase
VREAQLPVTADLAARRVAAVDILALTKPRITLMVVLTAFVGFVMASPERVDAAALLLAMLGTGLVAGGASTLNMLLERRTDALMLRTQNRPLPAGRLGPSDALAAGALLTVSGLSLLAWSSGLLAASVALVTWASYLFLYTPLKVRTSLSTVVGAFPGALPPVIGWAAARGHLEPGALFLFAIVFFWQIPHFLAIAWIYRDDYARGGMPMLPVLDRDGAMTGRQAVINSVVTLAVSLLPFWGGLAGRIYLAGATTLGLALVAASVRVAVQRSLPAARGLFLVSVLYLTALCGLLLVDRL